MDLVHGSEFDPCHGSHPVVAQLGIAPYTTQLGLSGLVPIRVLIGDLRRIKPKFREQSINAGADFLNIAGLGGPGDVPFTILNVYAFEQTNMTECIITYIHHKPGPVDPIGVLVILTQQHLFNIVLPGSTVLLVG